MEKLIPKAGCNYSNVRRLSNSVICNDIFSLDKIFVPMSMSNTHQTCAAVHFQLKEIRQHDSMQGSGDIHTNSLLNYLKDEWREKSTQSYPIGMSGKRQATLATFLRNQVASYVLLHFNFPCIKLTRSYVPHFSEAHDCGVHVCLNLDLLSQGTSLSDDQRHIGVFRSHVAIFILDKIAH